MTDAVDIGLSVSCERWPEESEDRCRAAALAALAEALRLRPPAGADAGMEVGILLADDAEVREMNRRFRGQDKATNVLSFAALDGEDTPGDHGEPLLLGDIAIAFETTAAEAADAGIALSDHLGHLVVHGVLHLFGYDHDQDDAAEEMERIETAVLAGLGIADPYARGADVRTTEPL